LNETRDGKQISPQWQFRPLGGRQQTPVVQNTWYTMIPTTSDVIVNYISFTQQAPQTGIYEFRATIDGNVISISGVNPAAGRLYLYLDAASDVLLSGAAVTAFAQIAPIYARSFTLEGRNTNDTSPFTVVMRWQSL